METPVALFIFNRLDTTERVFAEIARAKPTKLFIIADGPRPDHPDDVEKCAAARSLIHRVDWKCNVQANFSDINLGCAQRMITGLNWLFEIVEEAIILEDDCLPDATFFPFCEEMIARYRYDERVMVITGTNFLGEWKSNVQSYHYSYLGVTWGWASWRRAWRFYDPEIKLWPRLLEERFLDNLFHNSKQSWYWKTIFQNVYQNQTKDTWDYQMALACWLQSGFSILPAVNLVSNIGWTNATHTHVESPVANMPTIPLSFPLKHPAYMARSVEADNRIQEMLYNLNAIARILLRQKDKGLSELPQKAETLGQKSKKIGLNFVGSSSA